MSDVLKNGGYIDVPMWGKTKNEKGEDVKVMTLPITRYANVLGRPSVVKNANAVGTPDFALLKTSEITIPDEAIFSRANQSW